MFTPSHQTPGPGGLQRLRFDLPTTLRSAVLDSQSPVLALTTHTPDRLPHQGWLRLGQPGQAFARGLYLPELVREPAGRLWVCAGLEVEEKEREVLFPLGETFQRTRSHIPSTGISSLGFSNDSWVRLFDKGYALDPLDPKKKRTLVRLKESPPRSAQLDALGEVHFLSGFRPLVYRGAELPALSGGNGGFHLLATSPHLDILTGDGNRLLRHRLVHGELKESQTLLQLPGDDNTFYSLWNPQNLGEGRFLARFTFDQGNGWALLGPQGLERSRLSREPGSYLDEKGQIYRWSDGPLILHSLDSLGGSVLETYYSKEDPHTLWLVQS
ncbi:MAG: hypothetical protein J0I12_30330 [Candidatus Eremiobacteraeota bacterium]|nr:hypothetical protein [Candidatus Eremiobacteraeota bacterium]